MLMLHLMVYLCSIATPETPFSTYEFDKHRISMQFDTGSVTNYINMQSKFHDKVKWIGNGSDKYATLNKLNDMSHRDSSQSLVVFSTSMFGERDVRSASYEHNSTDGILGCHFLSKNKYIINHIGRYTPNPTSKRIIVQSKFYRKYPGSLLIDHVYLFVKVENRLRCVMLDTGSSCSIINSLLIKMTGEVLRKNSVYTLGTRSTLSISKSSIDMAILTVGDASINVSDIYYGDLTKYELNSHDSNVECVGIIGNDLVRKLKIVIDFDNECVFIEP